MLKVTDRTATVGFLRDVLGMHTLRHEVSKREAETAAYKGNYHPIHIVHTLCRSLRKAARLRAMDRMMGSGARR